jgi:hypothetical protein
MGKRTLTLFALLLATISILAQGGVRNDSIRKSLRARKRSAETAVLDTAAQARFPVAETTPTDIDDIQQRPLDLKAPDNIVTDTVYNEEDGTYLLSTRLGKGSMLTAPILLTPEEYAKWKERSAMSSFFRKKNYEAWESSLKKDKFDFTDMHFDLGPAEKIFGPGGVRVKTQGNAELKIGYSIQSIDNPALPSRSRRTNSFDFDEKINLNV